jgi:hypothetical protein
MQSTPTASAQSGSVESLLGALKSARVFDLSFTWSDQSPVLSLNPPYSFALNRTHKMTHEIFGQVPGSRVSWASEIMFFSGQHGAPTIDAIGHVGRDLKLHGGVDAVSATSTPGGIGANLGIDRSPTAAPIRCRRATRSRPSISTTPRRRRVSTCARATA